jgi:hypothetical protein
LDKIAVSDLRISWPDNERGIRLEKTTVQLKNDLKFIKIVLLTVEVIGMILNYLVGINLYFTRQE